MTNYNKSFNFQNGVQVDTDNFVVNSSGLVGIGTSIPEAFLDVRGASSLTGDVTVSGLVTTTQLTVTGVSTFIGGVGIGTTNITGPAFANNSTVLNAGIVTAKSFYGDGSKLTGIVGFATAGWNIITPEGGSANQGISTTSKVGIGTTLGINKYDLIIGQDPASSQGISFDGSGGNVRASGIITATAGFVGVGSLITTLNASNISSGTINNDYLPVLDNDRLPTAIDIGATGTFNSETITGAGISITGIATAASGFVGNLTGNVVGIATTARDLTSDATVKITSIDSATIVGSSSTIADSIGVGTDSASADIQIRKNGAADLLVTSDTNAAIIGVGRSNTLTGNTGQLRYGNATGSFTYSHASALDILNYPDGTATSNMNFHLDAGNVGVNTGSFYWHKTTTPIMSLTYDGKLGIGITVPEQTLHVSGASTITGNSWVGNNLNVGNNLTVDGSLNSNVTGDLTGDVTGNLTGNVNAASGISTFTKIKTTGSLGVGFAATTHSFEVNPSEANRFVVSGNGNVGIGTTIVYDLVGLAVKTQGAFSQISVGSTDISGSVDFSKAGGELENEAANITKRFMVPPKVTSTERGNLTGLVSGAMVYDTTLNKLVLYQGASWVGIGTTTL